MRKRLLTISLALAMVGAALSAPAAQAQIPDAVNIDDPFGDANYVNDQGNGGSIVLGNEVPRFGDVDDPPADASTVADLGKIWFENDSATITVFIQTELPLGNNGPAYIYDVFASPGEGSVASSIFWCVRFSVVVPGKAQGQQTTWQGDGVTKLLDRCNVGADYWAASVDGELEIITEADGTGLLKLTFPRSYSPLLADGGVLTTPYARSANAVGQSGRLVSAPQVDNTAFGTDYPIVSGGGEPPVVQEPPVDDPPPPDDPPVKKGCKKKKGKGKKKGCDKGKGPIEEPGPGCADYVPGENGAEAETLTVTDAATEEEPVTVEFDAGTGMGGPVTSGVPPDQTTHNYHNVQIDSDSPEVGLYARIEFTDRRDYDLHLEYPDGTDAASSGDFNSAAELLSCGDGCSSGSNFEQVNGIRTADCQGWTTDSVAFLTEGGDVTLSLWLGEIQNDPAPPA